MPDNQLILQPSNNRALSNSLMGIETALEAAARENVRAAGEGFSEAEKSAMIVIEKLKLVNGMDLAAVMLRYKLLKQIEESNLWTIHPGGYQSRDEMARDQGISPAELSNIYALGEYIFPYIENVLHVSVAVMWEQIGKSNFSELIPVLKRIITGEGGTQTVINSVNEILDDAWANARSHAQANNLPEPTPDEVNASAVRSLLEAGGQMRNRELRAHIRRAHADPINADVIVVNGRRLMIAELDEEQWNLVNRALAGHMDASSYSLPSENAARQREAGRIPALRRVVELIS